MGINLTPAKNAADAWNMLTLQPLPSNDKRYLDCSGVHGINAVQQLTAELQLHSGAKLKLPDKLL
jgi:hypothetical protein